MLFRGQPLRETFLSYARAIFGLMIFKDRDAPGGTMSIDG
jgi:hypothetical protein